jgi:D-xylose transport system substrate-binding protein
MRGIINIKLFIILTITALFASACVCGSQEQGAVKKTGPIRIGVSFDTLKEERWQHDLNLFTARAKELGAEVISLSADGNDDVQNKQVENLLTQGIDILVIVPHNAEVSGAAVNSAKNQGVPVLSYDRLVKESQPDLYVSFDNVKVGELQAQYLLARAPKGNYILIGGAPTDNNAKLFREGQMNILNPAIERGDIKIVADQWARDWQPNEALKHTENALTQASNNVAAVVASNDGTAGGSIQALQEQRLTGKVFVSGQDAELAALQRIIAGTQSMTVYKPISKLAVRAAEAAVALARGEKLETGGKVVNNGKVDVPSILLEPIVVDKSNIDSTVIADGYQKREEIYKK